MQLDLRKEVFDFTTFSELLNARDVPFIIGVIIKDVLYFLLPIKFLLCGLFLPRQLLSSNPSEPATFLWLNYPFWIFVCSISSSVSVLA